MLSHPLVEQLASSGVRLGLTHIRSFLGALGDPQRCAPVVHVAGTNGKGSVCAMVTAALVEAGYSVGTTVSPHVEHLNERVQIDGVPCDDPTLVEAMEVVDRARWDWAQNHGLDGVPLTYFEFMVATAFVAFARRGVDVIVAEVGLGGRLDATNVVDPVVCAVTSIGLDHTEQLGDTLAQIAGEKAGIIKRGVPVVIGPMAVEATEVLVARCRALGAPLWKPPGLLRERQRNGWRLQTPRGALGPVELGMGGTHQGANAVVATGVLHQLADLGFAVTDDQIAAGLARARMPCRLERVHPKVLVDGAHNVPGSEALARYLSTLERPQTRILLVGMGEGRDPAALMQPLLAHFDEVVTTRCSHPKAADPMAMALLLSKRFDGAFSAGESIEVTLPEVLAEADEVVVAGSLFIAGAARSLAQSGMLD